MQHTDTTTTDTVAVVTRWDHFDGYHYVGPFSSVSAANEWAIEHDGDPCWHTELVDPEVPLEVREVLPAPSVTQPTRDFAPITRRSEVASTASHLSQGKTHQ
ncbi:MAG TPA: hypothetical protein VFL55_25520 [Acetobacteraceae bacterium]|nr:hypothetical protein [Acetobacteraceae bacterium]